MLDKFLSIDKSNNSGMCKNVFYSLELYSLAPLSATAIFNVQNGNNNLIIHVLCVRKWGNQVMACRISTSCFYLKQCWLIIYLNIYLTMKFRVMFKEYAVCKIATILSRPQYENCSQASATINLRWKSTLIHVISWRHAQDHLPRPIFSNFHNNTWHHQEPMY